MSHVDNEYLSYVYIEEQGVRHLRVQGTRRDRNVLINSMVRTRIGMGSRD